MENPRSYAKHIKLFKMSKKKLLKAINEKLDFLVSCKKAEFDFQEKGIVPPPGTPPDEDPDDD